MQVQRIRLAPLGLYFLAAVWLLSTIPLSATAAPYAAHVIDARTGEVLHSRNADTRLHPASLTKMMTLYIAFEAVQNGEITLDTKVRVSRNAASEPPSKLGLKSGQRIAFRYLIRAAAVKSANDAATAIGEAISGSEAAFARRMNRTAKSLGMTRTTFKNANGLTEKGHLSTARDMTTLGRHILYDYPQYYNLFSRRTTYAGIKEVPNTNRRLLAAYRGADGIKTGYTRAAGFNLVASAKRGNERIIATVFGGQSSAARNARVAELLDMGFRRAPSRAPLRKPARPAYVGNVGGVEPAQPGAKGKTIRLVGAVNKSLRPRIRPAVEPVLVAAAQPEKPALTDQQIIQASVAAAIAEAQTTEAVRSSVNTALAEAQADQSVQTTQTQITGMRPAERPENLVLASTPAESTEPEIVTRLSTSGGKHWGINVGRFNTRYDAEKVLLKTALAEMTTLDGSLRKVVQSPRGFDATFMGMTQEGADLACRRLQARHIECSPIGPS